MFFIRLLRRFDRRVLSRGSESWSLGSLGISEIERDSITPYQSYPKEMNIVVDWLVPYKSEGQ